MQASILVVDDQPENFDVIEVLLQGQDYDLNYASNGCRAIERLEHYSPDVILLDVMMPEMDGLEVCRYLRSHPQWRTIPIIMVTALTAKEDVAKCLDAGADDFISKPLERMELQSRIRSMLRISFQYREIQQLCVQLQGANDALGCFNEELEEKIRERTAQLENIILYDTLTQLPSRTYLLQAITQELQNNWNEGKCGLIYLDCDQFKLINASLGHGTGDKLLTSIAERLQTLVKPGDVLARTGEDEFCLFLKDVENQDAVFSMANRILGDFNSPFEVDGFEIYTTACLGMTIREEKHCMAEELLQEADTAMYRAKKQGKGSYQLFERQMHSSAFWRLQLEQDMQRALKRQEFLVHYQPIMDLKTLQVAGFEALVRWQHPERGLVSPAEFIPCAEETGLVVPLGIEVLRMACEQLQVWRKHSSHLIMSVNLSVRQFAHPTLLEDIEQVLEETQLDPRYLKLEITESAIMENPETAIALTKELRARDIQLSIDDFGTGYSSLSYLSQFPVDSIKIDRSFVNKITSCDDGKIVEAIATLSCALRMTTVAEGIETEQQVCYLQGLGCDYGQGYFFSRPLPEEQVLPFLSQHSVSLVP
ncbi:MULTISPECIES: EAL domain-containing protein [unclassified Leptolyngbya]|uniref:EAL domain-containing response regulator n=1 Tax=unclassified Leptolyngbya TaxID=2650499 RepID=UPI00322071BC